MRPCRRMALSQRPPAKPRNAANNLRQGAPKTGGRCVKVHLIPIVKSPALRGFVGERWALATTSLYLVLFPSSATSAENATYLVAPALSLRDGACFKPTCFYLRALGAAVAFDQRRHPYLARHRTGSQPPRHRGDTRPQTSFFSVLSESAHVVFF